MATSRSLGNLTIDLIAKISGFTEGMSKAEREADRKGRDISRKQKERAKEVEKAWKDTTDNIGRILGTVGAAVAGGALFTKIATETANAQKEQALLAAALKATGNAAGYSLPRLNEMAGALESMTTFSGGEISDAQRVLTGYTNIMGKEFPKALQSAADYAAYTGNSMASAAETVGKALNIPSVGMKSLQRIGFQFTESQIAAAEALERTGRLAEAQQLVFDALDETYGGAAVAARDTLGGAYTALQNTINSLLTGEGGSFRELQDSINSLTTTLSSEQTRSAFSTFTSWIAEIANTVVKTAAVINDAGFWGWLQVGADDAKDVDKAITETERKIKELQKTSESLSRPFSKFWNADDIAIVNGQIATLQAKLGGLRSMKKIEAPIEAVTPSLTASFTPDLPFSTPTSVNLKDGTPKGKSQADKDREAAERYLKTLEKQLEKTQDLSAYEKLFNDIKREGLKLSDDQLSKAIGLATAVDMAAEAERVKAANLAKSNALFEQQESLAARASQYELTLSAYGLGQRQNEQIRERIALLQEQAAEVRKLQNDQANAVAGAKTEDEAARIAEQYETRLTILREGQQRELQMLDDFNAAKAQKDGDWLLGMQNAVNTYLQEAQNAYAAADKAMTSVLGSMEDALVSFVMTGKASFADFAKSILADIARIAAQKAIAGIAGSLFGGTGGFLSSLFGGGRAHGGTVSPGKLYEVNEQGPELITSGGKTYLMAGSQAGYVTPAATAGTTSGAGGGLSITVPVSVDVGGGQMDPGRMQAAGAQISKTVKVAVQDEVAQMLRPGGLLWAQGKAR